MTKTFTNRAIPGQSLAPDIIERVSDASPQWLTAMLQHAGVDAAVRAVSTAPIGTGQMGSTHRLRVEYEKGDGPNALVVKLPAADTATRSAGAISYRCETGFYREIAGNVKVRVPHCYFAGISENNEVFTLVLEDLAPAQQGDQIAGCTVEQARGAAINIAGLHGPTWNDPSLHELDWLIPGGADNAEFVADFLRQATDAFLDRFTLTDRTAEVLKTFAGGSTDWWRRSPEPFALLHSDYRLDNLMFAPAGAATPVVAVDWQVATIGLPLRDVAFLLGTGLQVEDRRSAERDIVADYHRALGAFGVSDYSVEQCWLDYRYSLFQGPMITVFGAFLSQPSERGERMFAVMAERSATAISDLDALSLL
ncbi:phosphotransferase [Mycobacterium intracellulare]|uniref:phosphotransferase n=1 Tax=Mycobacterium intracellulare TaxID=1767 RepID=UPI0009F56835|nr:phosphotransferase [Mycobacterium intracellulare]